MEVKPYGISVTVAFPPDTDTAGFVEENKLKPNETKLISESSGVFPPAKVADDILRDTLVSSEDQISSHVMFNLTSEITVQSGDFFTSTGLDGNLSTVITVGMSPMSSVFGLMVQVCMQLRFAVILLPIVVNVTHVDYYLGYI